MSGGPDLPPGAADQQPAHLPCDRAIELLGDLLEGALDPGTERDLRAHLAGCPPCVTFLEQLERTRRLVGRLPVADELPAATRQLLVREFGRFLGPAPEPVDGTDRAG